MTTENCGSCRFWKRKDYETYGYCRRRAPIYTTEAGGVFPDVRSDEWCGEHEPVSTPEKPQDDGKICGHVDEDRVTCYLDPGHTGPHLPAKV